MAESGGALQEAVYAALTGNAALTVIISGVYDYAPEGTAFPYVTIGDGTASDWSDKTATGQQQVMMIDVWSRKQGRKEVKQIMSIIHDILHQQTLTLVGFKMALMRHDFSETMRDSDGITMHGIIRFRAWISV